MLKRTIDIVASAAGLIVLSPLLLIVAAVIKWDSPGGIFFRQARVGRHGAIFRIHKFRTMRELPQGSGHQITIGADPRITRVGAFLREYKLDELPQLIDVLIGHMSLVGPRPEVPRYVELYPSEIRQRVLSVRPGITDRSSILFRNESALLAQAADPERYYIEELIPIKLRHHLEYVARMSVKEDLMIIWATLRAL